MNATGRPVQELTDDELESQGTQAHETRNWVFLHGSAEQFANHTARMLALEQEYLRRHPKRTWQGSGGAATKTVDAVDQLGDPVHCLLAKLAKQPGGRMHKLELHQAARECGLTREALAAMYNKENQFLVADRSDRVLTENGRAYLDQASPIASS
jgi:Family of unknown function (DUF6158)